MTTLHLINEQSHFFSFQVPIHHRCGVGRPLGIKLLRLLVLPLRPRREGEPNEYCRCCAGSPGLSRTAAGASRSGVGRFENRRDVVAAVVVMAVGPNSRDVCDGGNSLLRRGSAEEAVAVPLSSGDGNCDGGEPRSRPAPRWTSVTALGGSRRWASSSSGRTSLLLRSIKDGLRSSDLLSSGSSVRSRRVRRRSEDFRPLASSRSSVPARRRVPPNEDLRSVSGASIEEEEEEGRFSRALPSVNELSIV